jgi:ribosomal RNA assembly protein
VYTNASFANGRGISIVTTPSLATQFAALPAFHVRQSDHINTFSDTWFTSSIPGKGMGMLASVPLVPKTRVLAYTPVFLAYLESELDTMEREALWRVAIEQLPEKTRHMFLDLAVVFGDHRVKAQDVVKANTFQVVVGGGNHLVVWPETSRLNHECAPK